MVMADDTSHTTCCIVGGGPAGIMLGYLLARSGVHATVLEKHADFNRDFRGDTVHPSTLELIHELGLLDEFLRVPHQKLSSINGVFGGFSFQTANFSHLPTHCKFVALMPQWDFLKFFSEQARKFPEFQLHLEHQVTNLVFDGERVDGVQVRTPAGQAEIRADLVVGCDGRHSITRRAAHFDVVEHGVPIDVLWFRISRTDDDPEELFGNINYGRALVMINRGTYFQSGLIIRKGSFEQMQRSGIESFREIVRRIAPYLGNRVEEIRDWDQIKLLSVQINRLRNWYRAGLLCIGDAAHAMSPAGGVGINLAIQDAVAAARLLASPLRERHVTEADLRAVQWRREFPTRLTQGLQVLAHRGFARIFENPGPAKAPWQLKAVARIPGIQRVIGRVVGLGVRPEHLTTGPTTPCRVDRMKRIAVGMGAAAVAFALTLLRARQRSAMTG
jgi:2-polyprenyl-6-methoxyphenol hydroxylase-like FAD-dependent oxidoreductase